jgi:hypothetical protein
MAHLGKRSGARIIPYFLSGTGGTEFALAARHCYHTTAKTPGHEDRKVYFFSFVFLVVGALRE